MRYSTICGICLLGHLTTPDGTRGGLVKRLQEIYPVLLLTFSLTWPKIVISLPLVSNENFIRRNQAFCISFQAARLNCICYVQDGLFLILHILPHFVFHHSQLLPFSRWLYAPLWPRRLLPRSLSLLTCFVYSANYSWSQPHLEKPWRIPACLGRGQAGLLCSLPFIGLRVCAVYGGDFYSDCCAALGSVSSAGHCTSTWRWSDRAVSLF